MLSPVPNSRRALAAQALKFSRARARDDEIGFLRHAVWPAPQRETVPVAWDAASSRLRLNAVMQLHHTILEAINGVQSQEHVTMMPCYQWDAVPNENGGHTDDELVDRLRVKKRGDDLATAHQPDILARLLSQTAHEWADRAVHELHACRGVGWRRMTGEDD